MKQKERERKNDGLKFTYFCLIDHERRKLELQVFRESIRKKNGFTFNNV